ncbi:hypothetical protein [Variovorax sp. YR216]|uniref:hypothetical protein n=1 Tax=Variovorax sp. YR216 TaxID=1882828 RepID=UPI00115F79E3|nr:hypothetical protein [Variovorax sp. YR216]
MNITATHWVNLMVSGNIPTKIIPKILDADILIADITDLRSDVIWELGIRHATRARGTLPIAIAGTKPPFYLLHTKIHHFHPALDGDHRFVDQLSHSIAETLVDRIVDSSVAQADPARFELFEHAESLGIRDIGDWNAISRSPFVTNELGKLGVADCVYIVCINPQGTERWRSDIENVLVAGARVSIAYLELDKIAQSGPTGAAYSKALVGFEINDIMRNIDSSLEALKTLGAKAGKRRLGAESLLTIYPSRFPHTFLAMLVVPHARSNRLGWGVATSYLPYLRFDNPGGKHNFAVLFKDTGQPTGALFPRWRQSIEDYFSRLSNARKS